MMPADDLPFDALKHQFEMEDLLVSPIQAKALSAASYIQLPWPFDNVVGALKEHLATDSVERIRLMLEACMNEVRKHDKEIRDIKDRMTAEEAQALVKTQTGLLLDAARKAESTRSMGRVRRIGLILANGSLKSPWVNPDESEEMMRVAMELSDHDIEYLRELVRIQGSILQGAAHIPRFDAYQSWEAGFWGNSTDPELDSVFSKLESYGLVSRIPPPNNLNIYADFQNRYMLLKKGAWFTELIRETDAGDAGQ